MDRLADRIYHIAKDELPKRSLGLNIIGFDVCWGIWDVRTPSGPGKGTTFAMIFAVRPQGPRGEVLLGDVPPNTNAHALSGTYPSEAEIRAGVIVSCDALRAFIQAQHATQNGNNPFNEAVKDAFKKRLDGQ